MGVLAWDVITWAQGQLAFHIGHTLSMSTRIPHCPWTYWARRWRLHLWHMPEMVAPKALVFRPLVKGNEDSGNEIGFAEV